MSMRHPVAKHCVLQPTKTQAMGVQKQIYEVLN